MRKPRFEDYEIEIRRIDPDDGGGYSITFPDLPGCRSDGEDPSEAERNGRDAFNAWMDTCVREGREIPKPGARNETPAKVLLRVPRYIHAQIVDLADQQGVSLNTLLNGFICDGIARVEMASARSSFSGSVLSGLLSSAVAVATDMTAAQKNSHQAVFISSSRAQLTAVADAKAIAKAKVVNFSGSRRAHG
jgi:antitoxin HicB